MSHIEMKTEKEKRYFTEAHNRLWELLMRKSKSKSFNKKISELREEFGVPQDGFDKKPANYDVLGYKSFSFPPDWKSKVDKEQFSKAYYNMLSFAKENGLGILNAQPYVFLWLIFYGIYILPDDVGPIVLQDMVEAKRKIRFGGLKENYIFPVAILINPYASINEIVDFIETHSHRIKRLQFKYQDKSPVPQTVRLREPLKVTKFIQQNADKYNDRISLIRDVKAKFGIDYGESDIIRILHNKKKKEL